MTETRISRKQLYDLVWSTPMTTLAKQFQTTDADLRKICKNASIPVPKGGHWMKLKFGKPVVIEPFIETSGEQ